MKSIKLIPILLLTVLQFSSSFGQQTSDRFIGVHFDFNARVTDTSVGKNFSPALVDSFLRTIKPDYIQIDTKGNYGYSSYPTKAGNAAKGMQQDILQFFRQETSKYNIGLYAHYSSLIDNYAIKQHPEWANVKSDGSKDWLLAYGDGYTSNVMMPQLKELAVNYKLNGVWIDADAYAANLNYSPEFQAKFKSQYGVNAPKSKTDPSFSKWVQFNRDQYIAYFKNYVDALHNLAPGFKVMNNYAYTSYMPETPVVNVDDLSIDIKGKEPYQAAFEGRCMAAQNKPWDIMSWSMMQQGNDVVTKSSAQLAQEAANVIALGGGFEMYFFQKKNGDLPKENFQLISNVVSFCKARKEYCFNGSIVPQIGLFYSYNSWKDSISNTTLYSSIGTNALRETMKMLIDDQASVDVLMEHQLTTKLNSYPLVIIPGWNNLGDNVTQQLLAYVKNGGNLIVEGADAVKPFASYCDITTAGRSVDQYSLNYNNASDNVKTAFQKATVSNNNVKKLGSANFQNDRTAYPLATISSYGKGKIALVYFNVENLYSQQNIQSVKNLLGDITSALFTTPVAKVSGADNIEQLVTKKDGHLYVHLINMSGKNVAYNKITLTPSFNVQVRTDEKPNSVLLQPGNKTVSYTYNNGIINAVIPGVDIYSIIDIQ